jgi:hypothetical protein
VGLLHPLHLHRRRRGRGCQQLLLTVALPPQVPAPPQLNHTPQVPVTLPPPAQYQLLQLLHHSAVELLVMSLPVMMGGRSTPTMMILTALVMLAVMRMRMSMGRGQRRRSRGRHHTRVERQMMPRREALSLRWCPPCAGASSQPGLNPINCCAHFIHDVLHSLMCCLAYIPMLVCFPALPCPAASPCPGPCRTACHPPAGSA